LLWGLTGVLVFSGTLPATRLAVGALGPMFVASARALVAAVLAGLVLALSRRPLPERRHWLALLRIGACVVVAFPVLTSLALRNAPAVQAAVIVGLMPAATAVAAVLRAGERPS